MRPISETSLPPLDQLVVVYLQGEASCLGVMRHSSKVRGQYIFILPVGDIPIIDDAIVGWDTYESNKHIP